MYIHKLMFMSKQRKRLLLNDLTAERWYINMSTHRFDLSCYKYLREKMYKFETVSSFV